MDLWKNKIAVVTGASSGIGAQIALDLANSDVKVIALARRKERLDELAKNSNIYPLVCDVSDQKSIEETFSSIQKNFGKIHILINNAGRVRDGTILDMSKSNDDFRGTIDVNLTAAVICTREAFKLMETHEEPGFIININSVLGQMTPQAKFLPSNVYPATKHALKNFTETIRLELVAKNLKRIRICNVTPGLVKTEITEAAGHPKELCEKIYKSSLHLMPSDISAAVLYILSQPNFINITELTIKPTGETF
ncbi:farnesol dehydrogenase-like [Culicoides brevitarsis]|uniref:farnesol dehydrogenase-like n=1 Tax=Culicoides brevitarsis TaxID=469753 RepID=UPI00307B718D